MKINRINISTGFRTNFAKNREQNNIEHDPENPIKKPFEQLDVIKATALTGLGFGARALYYAFEDTDILEYTYDASKKLTQKNYGHIQNGTKRLLLGIASYAAILTGIVGIIAGLYTAFNAPKSIYQGKINAHKKSEEMDIYLANNRIEKDLYGELSNRAKEIRTQDEQNKLKQQYMILNASKNQAPAFINFENHT